LKELHHAIGVMRLFLVFVTGTTIILSLEIRTGFEHRVYNRRDQS